MGLPLPDVFAAASPSWINLRIASVSRLMRWENWKSSTCFQTLAGSETVFRTGGSVLTGMPHS
jgi:hypothetical protein